MVVLVIVNIIVVCCFGEHICILFNFCKSSASGPVSYWPFLRGVLEGGGVGWVGHWVHVGRQRTLEEAQGPLGLGVTNLQFFSKNDATLAAKLLESMRTMDGV